MGREDFLVYHDGAYLLYWRIMLLYSLPRIIDLLSPHEVVFLNTVGTDFQGKNTNKFGVVGAIFQ